MKTQKTHSLKLFATAAFLTGLVGTAASAAIITPTSAVSANGNLSNRPIDTTIDGSGLTDPSTPGNILDDTHIIAGQSPNNQYFIASGTTNVQLDFDLGGTFTVDGIHLWNYAATNNTNNRGLGEVDVLFSTDGGTNYGNQVTVNFDLAANQTPVVSQTKSFAAVAGVTDIRFIADNQGGSHTAFMEIRFNEVPEPGSLALLGLGGLLIGARRRRG